MNQDDEDLFPKDFIVNLSAGSDYFGPNKLFNNEENDSSLPLVINVNDFLTFVPKKHKKDDIKLDFIPESLRDAILMFIITIAIRNIRGHGNKHNSMLIHVTRFTIWQTHIRYLIEEEFEAIKNKIKAKITNSIYKEIKYLYYGKGDKYPSYNNITAEVNADKDLNDPFIKQHNWEEIEPLLKNIVETIQIKEIHGKSNDVLSYYDEPNGINAILIGGNKLSRGLTIEGLSVSYFLRTSKMYDTLMQMGRWFGYRKGYADLCRIYTTSELEEYYKHITLASIELREDFDDMNRKELAPEDFLLKVRSHPENLRITAANKMRNSTKISISWSGKLFETYKLSKISDSIEQNYKLLDNLLLKIDKYDRTNSNNRFLKNNYLYSNIDNDLLYEFINKFSMEKEFSVIKYEPLKYYISEMFQRNIYKKWNLVIINKNNASIHDTYKFGSISVGAVTRTEESMGINKEKPKFSEYFSIRKSHIISPEHETLDLSEEKIEKALKETKIKFKEKYSDKYGNKIENEIEKIKIPNGKHIRDNYREKDSPLIIIYIIDKKSHLNELKNYDYPLIGFAISFPESKDFKSTEYAIPEWQIENLIEFDKDLSLKGEDENED